MSRLCSVCTSPNLQQIDIDLASGRSAPVVARTYQLGADSIRRHRRQHLSPALTLVAQERAPKESAEKAYESVHDRLEALGDRIERFLDVAEARGQTIGGAQLLAQMRMLLETLGRMTGELDTAPQVAIFNVHQDAEWLAIRTRMMEALEPYLEARFAILQALRSDPAINPAAGTVDVPEISRNGRTPK